jgi:polyhydroxyalkanoate synthesis regulator phasin
MREELKRLALFTSGVAELTRNRAERLVRDLVSSGDVPHGQAGSVVREVLKRSSENRRELMSFVRGEIENQVQNLGLASRRDLERLERKVARLEERARTSRSSQARPATKTSTARTATASGSKRAATRSQSRKKTSAARRPADQKAPGAGPKAAPAAGGSGSSGNGAGGSGKGSSGGSTGDD